MFQQMPGSAKGHKQGDWDEDAMKAAVHAILVNGVSQKRAAVMQVYLVKLCEDT